jgi:hypothetical protein
VPPDPKILLRDPIVGPYILKKFQIDTTLLTPSKIDVTEHTKHMALIIWLTSDFFLYADFKSLRVIPYRVDARLGHTSSVDTLVLVARIGGQLVAVHANRALVALTVVAGASAHTNAVLARVNGRAVVNCLVAVGAGEARVARALEIAAVLVGEQTRRAVLTQIRKVYFK